MERFSSLNIVKRNKQLNGMHLGAFFDKDIL